MQSRCCLLPAAIMALACLAIPASGRAQSYGTLRGTVVLEDTGDPLPHASVLVVELRLKTETSADGTYEFQEVPPGMYEVMAHMHPLSDLRQTVEVTSGSVSTLNFELEIAPVREQITVTASGREQTTLETFQSVVSLELLDLAPKASASLGEALEGQPGVAKRSYGPGTSRPVVRGFDGDRVLILEDGLPTGTLSSQSGDHGEPFDVSAMERVEVVRGPATLLYGANALGGAVNVITGHHEIHQHAHEGLRGSLSATGGTNDAQAGGNGGIEFGVGKWLFSATGGGLRTGDYSTPEGKVQNSGTQIEHGSATLGHYSDGAFFHLAYGLSDGVYGIPTIDVHHGEEEDEVTTHAHHEGDVDLKWRRQNTRFSGGFRNINSYLDRFTLNLNYSDWHHRELVGPVVGTEFSNKQFVYRGVFDQQPRGGLLGSFGVYGHRRSYNVRGEEQLTPPVTQDVFAVFGLEEIAFRRFRVQLGGRMDSNRYAPEGLQSRSFTGFSGSAGINAPLWRNGVLVGSYTYSYRAPSVEELYNYGPHHGSFSFEIGDVGLKRERGKGVETAYRYQSDRMRGEISLFYYLLKDYVYLAPTGVIQDGLIRAEYKQADSRYMGAEANLEVGLHPHLWMRLGVDSVDAQLRVAKVPLPRIPPLRGRIGLDANYKGLSLRPELILTNAQNQLYFNEKRTTGHALVNLGVSYTVTRQYGLHMFSVNLYNAGNRLYRNHVSLIKEYVPEIGRGVRFSYTVRFF